MIDSDVAPSDYLAKVSIAPQVQAGPTFWGRPVVRAYLTYAFWGDEFKGIAGGPAYVDKNAQKKDDSVLKLATKKPSIPATATGFLKPAGPFSSASQTSRR